jgi:hypothetical protein
MAFYGLFSYTITSVLKKMVSGTQEGSSPEAPKESGGFRNIVYIILAIIAFIIVLVMLCSLGYYLFS